MITIVFFDKMSDFAKIIPQKELVYLLNLIMASSEWIPAHYSKYTTGTDRRSVRKQTVSDCFKAYNNMVYAVKYCFFARILTPRGAQTPLMY
jgi:hypothetical protein